MPSRQTTSALQSFEHQTEAMPVLDERVRIMQSDTESPEAKDAAFGSIFDEYSRPLTRYAASMVGDSKAEDIVQDTLLGAWCAMDRFKPMGPRALPNLLYKIARNRSLNEIRKDTYGRSLEGPIMRTPPRGDPVAHLEFYEDFAALGQMIESQREVLVLSEVLGLSPPELADKLSTSLGAAKCTLARSRQAARRILRAQDESENEDELSPKTPEPKK